MAIEIPPAGTRGTRAPPGGPLGRGLNNLARLVHRLTGNKMSGQPLLHLRTIGAKSGQPRTSVVMAFPDGDDAWLAAAWERITTTQPRFAGYERKTDRQLPVVRLAAR